MTDIAGDVAAGIEAAAELARRLPTLSWFAALGEEVTSAERADAEAYLAGLALPGVAVMTVASWNDAKARALDPAWDRVWWEAEEARRRSLEGAASEAIGRDRLMALLTDGLERAASLLHGAAAVAAARDGVVDAGLIRSAAGAAALAIHHALLERLAEPHRDGPFAAKLRLFEAGRWPLCVVGRSFHLY